MLSQTPQNWILLVVITTVEADKLNYSYDLNTRRPYNGFILLWVDVRLYFLYLDMAI